MKQILPLLFILFSGFYSTSLVFSQPGSPDLTFDGDGIVLADIGNDYANAITLQSDGKLVIAGYSYNGPDIDFSLIRLNTDGSSDNTFDGDGKLSADFGGFEQFASAVAIQSDGKIVAAGTTHNGLNNDIMLMRFNTDGSLDNSFDGDGIKIIDIGISTDYGRGVAIQSDGKIIVAGSTNDNPTSDFVVLRLNSDGSPDNSFDTDGLVLTDIDGADDYARALTIQSDGKILVAGNGFTGIDSDFVAARYNSDGSLDNSFNFDGKLFTDFTGVDDIGNAVSVHSDGSIVISGYAHNGIDNDFAVARYTSNGTLDVTFDTDGRVMTDIGGFEDQSFGCAIFADGKIIVSGSGSDMGSSAISLVCYDTDGSLETSFDTDGKILTYVMNDTYSTGVVIQPDGKFVAAGYGYGFAGSDFVIARYNGPDCIINTGVSVSGLTLTADATGLDYQWVDCDNSYAIIPSETNQAFTAASAGTYAVVITDGTCSDTSACFIVEDCNINTYVLTTGLTLTADAFGFNYQWVDCNNGYAIIPGETNQTYNAAVAGTYAVIFNDGTCIDTSDCYAVDDCNIDTGVTQTGFTLTANAAGLDYVWVDCDDNYSPVPFQTAQTFNASAPGNYAVIITDGTCSDTSACFLLDDTGFENGTAIGIHVFPNPTTGEVTIQLKNLKAEINWIITDISGKMIYNGSNLSGNTFTVNLADQSAGIYILEVTHADNVERIKLVKE